jgi:hypothetical protein
MKLSLILLLAITLGCATVKPIEVTLPEKPHREIIAEGATMAEILLYYEALVQKWEAWAASVDTIVK